jgi:hypothetical protein
MRDVDVHDGVGVELHTTVAFWAGVETSSRRLMPVSV